MKINTDMIKNEYLGDGVYVNQGRMEREIIITTDHHYDGDEDRDGNYTNIVYLDPYVAKELYRYLKNIFEV